MSFEFILNSFIFKLFIASLLGAVIGFERDIHGRAAGLRTNLLVSLGSAVFMILSESIALSHYTGSDPTRIAAQIITGIGFLGAGAIIKYGLSISGLTTAACLWISAAIGMSIGAGYYVIGILTTVLSLFSLIVLNKLENIYAKDAYRLLEIKTNRNINLSQLIDLIKRKDLKIICLDKEINYTKDTMDIILTIRLYNKGTTDKLSYQIINDLENSDIELYNVKWKRQ